MGGAPQGGNPGVHRTLDPMASLLGTQTSIRPRIPWEGTKDHSGNRDHQGNISGVSCLYMTFKKFTNHDHAEFQFPDYIFYENGMKRIGHGYSVSPYDQHLYG